VLPLHRPAALQGVVPKPSASLLPVREMGEALLPGPGQQPQ
jgi:hypothetical protein